MLTIDAQLRAWGRSLGIVVSKAAIIKENLREGDKVKLIILKRSNALKDTFGKFKFKRTTDEILKESDEESWDE